MIFQTFLKNYIEIVEKFGRMESDIFDSRFVFGNYLMSGGQNLNIGNFLPLDLDFLRNFQIHSKKKCNLVRQK